MTVDNCIGFCTAEGYKFAGVESGDECFCGDHAPLISAPKRECHLKCNGDETQICGGFWRMNVYFIPQETTTVFHEVTTIEYVPTTPKSTMDVESIKTTTKSKFSLKLKP